MYQWIACSGLLVWSVVQTAPVVEEGYYIEQDLVTESVAGQPAMKGKQQIWLTPNHIRNVVSFGKKTSVAIFNLKTQDIIVVPSEEKQYIQMKLKDYQRIVSMRIADLKLNDPTNRPQLVYTKEHRKIGDWNCTKVIFQQEGKVPIRVEMWISKDTGIRFADFLKIMEQLGMSKMIGGLSEYVSAIAGYPVELTVEQRIESQKQVYKTKVLRIVKGPVDPALFKIPEGYQRIQGNVLTEKYIPQGG